MALLQDVRFSLRSMLKSPRVAVTVILTLAFGIGANTAIFSIVNATVLRPLPFARPGELVELRADLPGLGSRDVGFSQPELMDLSNRAGIFEAVSAEHPGPANLTGGDHPERVNFLGVSPNYFSLLNSKPELGRLFDSRIYADGFAETVVISDGLWKRDFGGDRNVVGRILQLDNDNYTIIGVLPADFKDPMPAEVTPADVWLTAGFRGAPFPNPPERRNRLVGAIIGRLKPGISVPQAAAQLKVFADALRREYGDDYPASAGWTVSVIPLKDFVAGNSTLLLLCMTLAVAFILLIACVNVANILLASASTRQREISVRIALGANRSRIVRQLLTESAVLSLAAAVAGVSIAAVFLRFGLALLPSQLTQVNPIRIDGQVLGFTLVITFLTTIVFGLMPALRMTRWKVNVDELRGRGASGSARRSRMGRVLIGMEVALSLVLLVDAGLLIRTFWELLSVNPGFQTQHVAATEVWLPGPNDPRSDVYATFDQRTRLMREIMRRLSAIPGVQSAALSTLVPLQDSPLPDGFRVEGSTDRGDAQTAISASVTPGFFTTLGVPLMRGRFFQDTDTTQTPVVVVVDEAAARRFWGESNPIGQRIRLASDPIVDRNVVAAPWMVVVGVVANAKLTNLNEQNVPHIYTSMYQINSKLIGVVLRATGNTIALGRAIQAEIQSIDSTLPVIRTAEMKEIISGSTGDRRFAAWLIGGFAVLALLLTSLGIYGVSSYAVTSRTQELGIRSALGAARHDLIRMVLMEGMLPVVIGLVIGTIGALLSARLIAALLFGVKPTDVEVLVTAGATVIVIGFAANYIPALRAAKVDPMVALRND